MKDTLHNPQKLVTVGIRDLVTIGIFAAISLLMFIFIGGIAGMTVFGTIANIPIVCLFTAVPYLLLAAKVKKVGVFFLMGTLNVVPGLMVGNLIGVGLCVLGWVIAEIIASAGRYSSQKFLVTAYVTGCTIQSAGFTFPMYFSSVQYLSSRQKMLHLSDEMLSYYLSLFSWQLYGTMVALTTFTAFIGSVFALRLLKKHFVKAGLIDVPDAASVQN